MMTLLTLILRLCVPLASCLCLLVSSVASAATYGYVSSSFAWIDNASHTDVTWGHAAECTAWNGSSVDDDGTALIDIGFAFTFGATAFTQLRINSNGRLQFGNKYCGNGTQAVGTPPTYPYPYPDANMNNTMRVFGADFCPAGGGSDCGGRVTYKSLGTAPYRYFVVTWSQMKETNSSSSQFNVQIILYESGEFVYQFNDNANVTQGAAQTGYQISATDFTVVDSTTIGSMASTALRFFKLTAPVAEYRFDECNTPTPSSIVDSSGNNLAGSVTGGVSVAASGKICTAYAFNGTNGYITVPNNALLNQPYVTVAAWVRHTGTSITDWETILAKGDTTYRLHMNGGCSINSITTAHAFTFAFNGGCADSDLNSGVVPVAGQWYHVVGTYDGFTIKIFVNGVLMNSQALSTKIGSNTHPLYIGENAQQTGRHWSGDIDEVKIFSRALLDTEVMAMYTNESQGLQRDGSLRDCRFCNTVRGRYNAFEDRLLDGTRAPLANISGPIRTKVAGTSFLSSSGDIRIVALNTAETAVETATRTNLRVDVLDASGETGSPDPNGCYSGTSVIATAVNQTISSGVGVITPSFNIANAYKRVRLKVSSTGPTLIGCSADVFAIRPSYFNIGTAATKDATWLTTGTTRQLNNTSASGGNVHAAGKPFSISGIVAQNASAVTTTNYLGQPTILFGDLVLPDPTYCALSGYPCLQGTFNVSSWTNTAGVLSGTATYSDVGAFSWEVEDRTFADVDVADSYKAQRYFRSNAMILSGRFVPASYQLTLNTPVLQTFGSACAQRSFTYLGQPFGYATPPAVGVAAMNGATTPVVAKNYLGVAGVGGLWKLVSPVSSVSSCATPTQTCALVREGSTASPLAATRFTTRYSLSTATPGFDGAAITTTPNVANASFVSSNNGAGTMAFVSPEKLTLYRAPNTPQAPYTAAVTMALQLDDFSEAGSLLASCADTPAINGNPACISGTVAATSVGFDSGSEFRYGRMHLGNAYGSELLDLPLSLESQYWASGGYYVTNTADSCTNFNASSVIFSNFSQNLSACETQLAPTGAQSLVGGKFPLRLTRPSAGNNGSVNLMLNVGSAASGITCAASASSAASAANLPWFGTANPAGRATFGAFKTPLIYRRENY